MRENDLEALRSLRRICSARRPFPQKDGLHTYISIKFPLFKTPGNPYAICGISTDIAGRMRMEKELRESEQRYRTLFEASKDAIMIHDENGFLDCNEATLKVYGLSSREEFVGKRPDEFSPPRQPDGTESGCRR